MTRRANGWRREHGPRTAARSLLARFALLQALATKAWKHGGFQLMAASRRKLGDNLKLPSEFVGLVLHPDGKQVAIMVTEAAPHRDHEIWTLENFLPSRNAAK